MKIHPQLLVRIAAAGLLGSTAVTAAMDGDAMPAPETPTHTNRLAAEKSPYLLQHAHNPVDWYPWGEAAFEKARKEDKPIFLSVGYSTCHWCHVMERESFENEAIADLLNEHFVSIKVDREERPDIDSIYMTYVQATTGGGGWPLNVWLTPELKPFFGGTYFPPEDRWGRPGLPSMLERIATAWREERSAVESSADQVTRQLRQFSEVKVEPTVEAEVSLLDAAVRQIQASYDPQFGGFGGAPKFPRPVTLNFLLRSYVRTGDPESLQMTLHTLRKMAEGGMHDQLGGGFHRYSVDATWHVPHFEKMLYDQAQLATVYLDAFQLTRDSFYADVARDILDYVLREMTGPEGEFYSAEDADSIRPEQPGELVEGAFYVWTQSEINAALGEKAAAVFSFHYGVEPAGNAPSDPHGEFRNQNILSIRHTLAETADAFGLAAEATDRQLAASRRRLLDLRDGRPRPRRDDKALTAWNGLMISAFARAASILQESRYRSAAVRAADYIDTRLSDPATGQLLRRSRGGESAIDGFVDDYAFTIQGLLDLYEASLDVRWLERAIALQRIQDERFWDPDGGGYFTTAGEDPNLLFRIKDDHDGAEPSPNSIAALNLLRLSQMTDAPDWRVKAERLFAVFGAQMKKAASAMPQMLAALEFHLSPPRQIILAGTLEDPDTQALLQEVYSRFLPNTVLLLADGGEGQRKLAEQLEYIRGNEPLDGRATAYVCEQSVCQLPVTDPSALAAQLRPNRPPQEPVPMDGAGGR
jgi:uncharacterized protein